MTVCGPHMAQNVNNALFCDDLWCMCRLVNHRLTSLIQPLPRQPKYKQINLQRTKKIASNLIIKLF